MTERLRRRLVLAGGGHAQVAVLRSLAMSPITGCEITLINPQRETFYSGMLPGVLAGLLDPGGPGDCGRSVGTVGASRHRWHRTALIGTSAQTEMGRSAHLRRIRTTHSVEIVSPAQPHSSRGSCRRVVASMVVSVFAVVTSIVVPVAAGEPTVTIASLVATDADTVAFVASSGTQILDPVVEYREIETNSVWDESLSTAIVGGWERMGRPR